MSLEEMLWGEADRMKNLALTGENLKNQQGVVGNEVKVNVINQALRRIPLARHAGVRQQELVQRPQLLRRPGGHRSGDAAGSAESFYQDVLRARTTRPWSIMGDFDPVPATCRWVEKYFARNQGGRNFPKRPRPGRTQAGEGRAAPARTDALAHAPGDRNRLSHAGTQHAGVLRHGADRPDPARRATTVWLYQVLVQRGGLHRRTVERRDQSPGQHVRLRRPDAVDGVALSRREPLAGRDPEGRATRQSTRSPGRPSTRPLSPAPRSRSARTSTTSSAAASSASAAPISSRPSRSSTTTRPASIRSNGRSARSRQPSSRKPPANTSAPATRRSSPS